MDKALEEKPVSDLFGQIGLKELKYMYGAIDFINHPSKLILAKSRAAIMSLEGDSLGLYWGQKNKSLDQIAKYVKKNTLPAYKKWLKRIQISAKFKLFLNKDPEILPFLYVGFMGRVLSPLDLRKTVKKLAKAKVKKTTAALVKDDTPYQVVDSGKGKKTPVGAVRIAIVQGKTQVKQKTAAGWNHVGTLGVVKGNNKGTAETFLQDSGFDLADIEKHYDLLAGVTLLPPQEAEAHEAPLEKPSDIQVAEPTEAPSSKYIEFPDAKEQALFTKATQDAHAFYTEMQEVISAAGGAFEKNLDTLKKKYKPLVDFLGQGSYGAYTFIKEIYPFVTQGGDLGISVDNWHKSIGSPSEEKMADKYHPQWAGVAYGIAASLQKSLGGEGDSESEEIFKEVPSPAPQTLETGKGKKTPDGATKVVKVKDKVHVKLKTDGKWQHVGTLGAKQGKNKGVAENHLQALGLDPDKLAKDYDLDAGVTFAAGSVPAEADAPETKDSTKPIESKSTSKHEDLAKQLYDFYQEVGPDKAEQADFGEIVNQIKSNHPGLSTFAQQVGSYGSLYFMANDLQKETKLGGSPDQIVSIWSSKEASDDDEMSDLFGPDWEGVALALVDIFKNTKGKQKPDVPEKPSYQIIDSGKGKKTPSGAIKIFTFKGKVQIRLKTDKGWDQIGTVGSTKGKNKGQAEEFLAKHGINLDDLDVVGGVTVLPSKDEVADVADSLVSSTKLPSVSPEVKEAMFGFEEMYQLVKDAGGPFGLDTIVKEVLADADPEWGVKYAIGDLVDKNGVEEIFKNAKLSASAKSIIGDKWDEYVVEAHEQLKAPAGVGSVPAGEPSILGKEAKAEAPKKSEMPKPVTPKPKKEPEYGTGYEPAKPDTAIADLPIPPPSGLKKKKSGSSLGGAGQKDIYVDDQGNEFLFKLATSKSGGSAEPFRAHVQAGFSEIAREIKPFHPRIEVTKLEGTVGAIYPFLPASDKIDLAGQSPSALSDQEKLDVAEEHLLDWVMSQHDSHSKNFLRTKDGRLIGIDKEQGFKYMKDDKLDIDYHPNSKYGEEEPFYNKFWREYAQGKNDFDPQKMSASVDKIMRMDSTKIRNALRGYAEEMFPNSKVEQDAFLRTVENRKNTLKRDFEKFLTDLTKKRTGDKGEFRFSTGWVKEGAEKTKTIQHPAQTKTAMDFLNNLGGQNKTEPHLTDSSLITVKSTAAGSNGSALIAVINKMGIEVKEGPISGSKYTMVMVDKAAWEAVKEEVPAYTETVKIDTTTEIQPAPDYPEYMPEVGVKEETKANLELLDEAKSKDTEYGIGLTFDGKMVEQQRGRVTNRVDESNSKYVEVSFKLRGPIADSVEGGAKKMYQFPIAKMEAGSLKNTDSYSDKASARVWKIGNDEIYLCNNDKGQYSYAGLVVMRIYSDDVKKVAANLLDKMKKGLAKDILKPPSEEDKLVAGYSSALKAVAPQIADQLDVKESKGMFERTSASLRTELKNYLSEEEIDSIAQIGNGANAVQVIPERWRKLGTKNPEEPQVLFLYWNTEDADNVVKKFKTVGAAGILERNMMGLKKFGSSYSEDVGTGCADNMTMRLATRTNGGMASGYGNYSIVIAPDELDRLDPFIHQGDKYGCVNPNHSDSYKANAFKNRKPLNESTKTASAGDEIVVRKMVSKDKIIRVAVYSETDRKYAIQAFRKAGIEEIHKVPIEDFVVLRGSNGLAFYEKYVKPAGY